MPLTYAEEVLADAPAYWWRFTEASGPLLIARQPNPTAVMRGVDVVMGRGIAPDDGSIFGGSMTGARAYVAGLPSPGVAFPVFTWETWLWCISTTISQDGYHFGDAGIGGDGVSINYSHVNGWALDVKIGGATTTNVIITGTMTGAREWHHHALTYDGTTYRQFVDGTPHGSAVHAIAAPSARGAFTVLGSGGSAPLFEGAYCAEPAVYDYVLSDARILAHDAAGNAGYGPAISQPLPNPGFGSTNDMLSQVLASVRKTFP